MIDTSQKLERQLVHCQAYFEQFDDLTLAAMAYNLTDDAFDELTHTPDQHLPDATAWNLATSIANANMAMRVLVIRMAGSPAEAASAGVHPPFGSTVQ